MLAQRIHRFGKAKLGGGIILEMRFAVQNNAASTCGRFASETGYE